MSVARVTTINLNTKEGADELVQSYTANAPSEFPEAEQLLQIRVDDTTVMAISLYENNEAMERATAAKNKTHGLKKRQLYICRHKGRHCRIKSFKLIFYKSLVMNKPDGSIPPRGTILSFIYLGILVAPVSERIILPSFYNNILP